MADSEATATRRTANLVLVLLFFAGVITPCLGTILRLQTGGIAGENRPMARRPSLGVGPRQLPRQIDAWFNDHFGFRNVLVEAHGLIAYGVFGVSSSPDVVPGRDGWLFYAADRIIETRRGLLPFTREELAAWQATLEERRDWLAARRIRYVFTVAPEKSSLYAELLPPALQPVGDQTRADQLLAWMRAHSTVEIVDLREALRAAKALDRIYHRTDTHWNDLGAFAAYRSLAEWMQGPFPTVRPLDAGEFDRQVRITPAGDLAGMLALMPLLSEARTTLVPKTPSPLVARDPTAIMKRRTYLPNQEPKVFECPSGEIASAVVVHDSFVLPMRPFLARHFRRSTFLHAVFAPEVIAAERPDLVIEEMVERVLSRSGFLPARELATFDAADGSWRVRVDR